jgi:head-tail adaptor
MMRGLPRHLLNSTASVTRPTRTVDAGGTPTKTYAAHLSGVRCRVRTPSAMESMANSRYDVITTHHVYLPGDTDIQEGDRMTISGRVLDVQGVLNPGLESAYLRCDCEEKKSGN